jgi:hypothetical protein
LSDLLSDATVIYLQINLYESSARESKIKTGCFRTAVRPNITEPTSIRLAAFQDWKTAARTFGKKARAL